jgi:hypothetical protein
MIIRLRRPRCSPAWKKNNKKKMMLLIHAQPPA